MNGHNLADSSSKQSSSPKEHHKRCTKHLLAVLGSSVMFGLKFSSTIQFCCIYPPFLLRPFMLVVLRYYKLPNLVFMHLQCCNSYQVFNYNNVLVWKSLSTLCSCLKAFISSHQICVFKQGCLGIMNSPGPYVAPHDLHIVLWSAEQRKTVA